MRRYAGLATWAASMILSSPSARAEAPPVVVLYAPGGIDAAPLRQSLERMARQHRSVLVDLTPPAPPVSQVEQRLSRAVDAYTQFHWDQALAELDDAARELDERGGRVARVTTLSDVFLYRGLVYTQRGDHVRAWDDFLRAATLAPARKLDPLRFAPTAVQAFERAQKAVAETPATRLTVDAPAACRVWLDGAALSERTQSVTRGAHFVALECPGYEPYVATPVLALAEHTLSPALTRVAVPSAEVARARGAQVGARRVLWVHVATDAQPHMIHLELYTEAGAQPTETGLVQWAHPDDAVRLADRLLTRAVGAAPPLVARGGPTPWYKKPWVWGVAGAAVATAVLLPFALASDSSGFSARLVNPR